ncbi:MAG: hypothetical protein ABEI78_02290, partial [Candidatus Nanohaloarchaea archaeon]
TNYMDDYWKYPSFALAGLSAYFLTNFTATPFSNMMGLSTFLSKIVLSAAVGLLIGFMFDEVIPAYIQNVRGGSSGGGGMDMGGDSGGDLDTGGDDDFDLE